MLIPVLDIWSAANANELIATADARLDVLAAPSIKTPRIRISSDAPWMRNPKKNRIMIVILKSEFTVTVTAFVKKETEKASANTKNPTKKPSR
jgi:hypothetical protein